VFDDYYSVAPKQLVLGKGGMGGNELFAQFVIMPKYDNEWIDEACDVIHTVLIYIEASDAHNDLFDSGVISDRVRSDASFVYDEGAEIFAPGFIALRTHVCPPGVFLESDSGLYKRRCYTMRLGDSKERVHMSESCYH